MNGFKFTDVSCLAVMVLVTMAFCGDAGQYLAMAAALIWLIAKAISLYRPRKSAPASNQPVKQPKKTSAPVAPAQLKASESSAPHPATPTAVKAQPQAPDLEAVMLRHLNFRITDKLQGAFPDAAWRWETKHPLEQAIKGGAGRIKVFGVPDWNFADVLLEPSGHLHLKMLSLRPLEELRPSVSRASSGDPDAVNLRDWYDLSASAVIRATIDEIYTRGFKKLHIAEDGELYVLEQQEQVKQGRLSHLPGKKLWNDLIPFFEEDDINAKVMEDCIELTWAD